MRLGSGRSTNIEDRRGRGGGLALGGGGMLLVLAAALFGGPQAAQLVASILGGQEAAQDAPVGALPEGSDPQADFVSAVLADTEQAWGRVFSSRGAQYQEPVLVLFNDAVGSACGSASSAVGPFYCPGDQRVYLDLGFFRELDRRFGAPGDFAQAYVVAHEVGHHVQNLLGISDRVHGARGRQSETEANAMSVRMELQADCFAGIWANHANRDRKVLEPGDVEEGLRAATAIGDDTLQKRSQGHVVPESFTHGSSAQRVKWFNIGLQSGSLEKCDTFSAASL